MIKTVIFRLESVILSSEILKFKLYVILWYYLKRDAFWKDFDQLMELREQFIEEYKIINPLNTIAKRYLSDRDYERFKQEIKLYIQKYSSYYIKIIPGRYSLNPIIQSPIRTAIKKMNETIEIR